MLQAPQETNFYKARRYEQERKTSSEMVRECRTRCTNPEDEAGRPQSYTGRIEAVRARLGSSTAEEQSKKI